MMNEELQRQFVEILKAAQSGAPGLFQELVRQASVQSWVQAIHLGLLAVFAVLAAILAGKKADRLDRLRLDNSELVMASALCWVAFTLLMVFSGISLSHAVAPLGGILGGK